MNKFIYFNYIHPAQFDKATGEYKKNVLFSCEADNIIEADGKAKQNNINYLKLHCQKLNHE